MKVAGRELPSAALRGAAILLVAALAGAAIAVLLIPKAPPPDDATERPPEVLLLGAPLALDDQATSRALERVRGYVARRFTLTIDGDEPRRLQPGRLGVEIDTLRLSELVRDARDPTSPMRRVWRRGDREQPLELPVAIHVNVDAALPTLLSLKGELDRLPVDARLDLERRELVPEVRGRQLDVDATLDALRAALSRGEPSAKVVFQEQLPHRIAKDLEGVQFDHVLGAFDTPYDRSPRAAARTFNLRLAASRLDGHVLLPGEVFDFNEVVGPRDEAAGYKVAAVIAQGELVDGIGGGTCQISGTLHGAAFFAGLEITERYPHTRPSSYIKMGMDAVVVYPTINFRIKNNQDFPIVLHQVVRGGTVRAEILGPKPGNTVTLIRRVMASLPYDEVERPDSSLKEGVRVLGQRGVPGFRLRRYRITREGTHAVRERWDETYPPTQQIIRVGTAPDGRERVTGDQAPEYLADELLIITKSPRDDDPKQVELRENREKGKTGTAGWIEQAGMPVFRTELRTER
ncbi:MAG: VanW family protein [Polyangiaceae bacterium]|nr:VanW family protein [Polyangiaceae bacterium]MCW5790658.1 VanW family protein [Polyangiaceae bacterium]